MAFFSKKRHFSTKLGWFFPLKGGKKYFPGTQFFRISSESTFVCTRTPPKTPKIPKKCKIWIVKCVKCRKALLCSSNICSVFFFVFFCILWFIASQKIGKKWSKMVKNGRFWQVSQKQRFYPPPKSGVLKMRIFLGVFWYKF